MANKTQLFILGVILLLVGGLTGLPSGPASAAQIQEIGPYTYWTADGEQLEAEPTDWHVVLLGRNALPDGFAARVEELGGEITHDLAADIGVVAVKGLTDEQAVDLDALGGVAMLARDVSVQWVPDAESLDLQIETKPMPEDPDADTHPSGTFFYVAGLQWNMSQTQADTAWTQTNQGAGATVAILDTGIFS